MEQKINEGDLVKVDFYYTLGSEFFGSTIGILTHIGNDGPYCCVDDKNIDLAGEAHTSVVRKFNGNKILLIGQAPPAVKQELPYDTTMLYDWLEQCGVSKATAQLLFSFQAMVDVFPGHEEGGHKRPTNKDMDEHFKNVLLPLVNESENVILLGNVAKEYFQLKLENEPELFTNNLILSCVIHPSKRNQGLFKKNEAYTLESFRIAIDNAFRDKEAEPVLIA